MDENNQKSESILQETPRLDQETNTHVFVESIPTILTSVSWRLYDVSHSEC